MGWSMRVNGVLVLVLAGFGAVLPREGSALQATRLFDEELLRPYAEAAQAAGVHSAYFVAGGPAFEDECDAMVYTTVASDRMRLDEAGLTPARGVCRTVSGPNAMDGLDRLFRGAGIAEGFDQQSLYVVLHPRFIREESRGLASHEHWRIGEAPTESLPTARGAPAAQTHPLITTGARVNVRRSPGATVLRELPFGSVVGRGPLSTDDGWQQIVLEDGTLGWMSAQFLQTLTPTQEGEISVSIAREKLATTDRFSDLVEVADFLRAARGKPFDPGVGEELQRLYGVATARVMAANRTESEADRFEQWMRRHQPDVSAEQAEGLATRPPATRRGTVTAGTVDERVHVLETLDDAVSNGLSPEVVRQLSFRPQEWDGHLSGLIAELDAGVDQTQSNSDVRRSLDLLARQSAEIQAVLTNQLVVSERATGNVILINVAYADAFERGIREWGFLVPLAGWRYSPPLLQAATQADWEAVAGDPIREGRWAGAYRVGSEAVLVPGLRGLAQRRSGAAHR